MTGRAMYLFLILSFFTGRIYQFAPPDNYYLVKVYHSIGLFLQLAMLIGYMICESRGLKRLRACMFFLYTVIAMFVFTAVQTTMDHEIKAHEWAMGLKESAPNFLYGNIGFLQDIFIPLFLVYVFWLFERRLDGRPENNG